MGRGQYRLVSGASGISSRKRIEIETFLRTSLKEGFLELVYQPQIDSNSLAGKEGFRIVGVEALLRINRGNQLAPPSEFIETAEESGLIVPIGQWVLERACNDASRWVRQGYPVQVSVNISPGQFEKGQIVEQTIHPLKTTGIRFAIDDFGTGYSSLIYVEALPLDFLKIDKSFIDDLRCSLLNMHHGPRTGRHRGNGFHPVSTLRRNGDREKLLDTPGPSFGAGQLRLSIAAH